MLRDAQDQDSGKRHKLFLAHNACLNSSYDFNLLREDLFNHGFELVDAPDDADEIIFSGCSVRDVWVTDAVDQLMAARARSPTARVTVTGCLANTSPEEVERLTGAADLTFESVNQILARYTGNTLQEVDRATSQNTSSSFESNNRSGLRQLRRRVGPLKAAVVGALQEIDRESGTSLEELYRRTTKGFVFYNDIEPGVVLTVTRSCPYQCSFCTIPRGRGAYSSVPIEIIVAKATKAVERGTFRMILVGDEVGNYGADGGGIRLPHLIEELLDIDSRVRVSIRYIEPKPLLRYGELIRSLCRQGRIELLYVSLQSGSQKVLDAMNRRYSLDSIAEYCTTLRQQTDTILYGNWMVGFPGETDDDYRMTRAVMEKLDFHINVPIPFSARAGTRAAESLEQVAGSLKEDRMLDLTRVAVQMKVRSWKRILSFLNQSDCDALISKIESAEMLQYEGSESITLPVLGQ